MADGLGAFDNIDVDPTATGQAGEEANRLQELVDSSKQIRLELARAILNKNENLKKQFKTEIQDKKIELYEYFKNQGHTNEVALRETLQIIKPTNKNIINASNNKEQAARWIEEARKRKAAEAAAAAAAVAPDAAAAAETAAAPAAAAAAAEDKTPLSATQETGTVAVEESKRTDDFKTLVDKIEFFKEFPYLVKALKQYVTIIHFLYKFEVVNSYIKEKMKVLIIFADRIQKRNDVIQLIKDIHTFFSNYRNSFSNNEGFIKDYKEDRLQTLLNEVLKETITPSRSIETGVDPNAIQTAEKELQTNATASGASRPPCPPGLPTWLQRFGRKARAALAPGEDTRPYDPIITIAGEEVILDEATINPALYQHYTRVSFSKKYFPGSQEGGTLETAKANFSAMFGKHSEFQPGRPLPACDISMRATIQEGIENRIETLADEIVEIRAVKGNVDSVDLTARLTVLERLKVLEAQLKFQEARQVCQDYLLRSGQRHLQMSDEQTTNELQDLLRKFSFLYLQDYAGIPEYKEFMDLAKKLIEALRTFELTDEELEGFLGKLKAAGKPIPDELLQTLDATDAQPGAVQQGVDAGMKKRMDDMVAAIRKALPEGLKEEFKEFVGRVDLGSKEAAVEVTGWLAGKIGEMDARINELAEELAAVQGALATCQGKPECDDLRKNEAILKATITELTEEKAAAEAAAEKAMNGVGAAEAAAARARLNANAARSALKEAAGANIVVPSINVGAVRAAEKGRIMRLIGTMKTPSNSLSGDEDLSLTLQRLIARARGNSMPTPAGLFGNNNGAFVEPDVEPSPAGLWGNNNNSAFMSNNAIARRDAEARVKAAEEALAAATARSAANTAARTAAEKAAAEAAAAAQREVESARAAATREAEEVRREAAAATAAAAAAATAAAAAAAAAAQKQITETKAATALQAAFLRRKAAAEKATAAAAAAQSSTNQAARVEAERVAREAKAAEEAAAKAAQKAAAAAKAAEREAAAAEKAAAAEAARLAKAEADKEAGLKRKAEVATQRAAQPIQASANVGGLSSLYGNNNVTFENDKKPASQPSQAPLITPQLTTKFSSPRYIPVVNQDITVSPTQTQTQTFNPTIQIQLPPATIAGLAGPNADQVQAQINEVARQAEANRQAMEQRLLDALAGLKRAQDAEAAATAQASTAQAQATQAQAQAAAPSASSSPLKMTTIVKLLSTASQAKKRVDTARQERERAEAAAKAAEEAAKKAEEAAAKAAAEAAAAAAAKEAARKQMALDLQRGVDEAKARIAAEAAAKKAAEEAAAKKAAEEAAAKKAAKKAAADKAAADKAAADKAAADKAAAAARPLSAQTLTGPQPSTTLKQIPARVELPPMESNATTFYAIFTQLKAGPGAQMKNMMKQDIAMYSEEDMKDKTPIMKFINKYSTMANYFQSLSLTPLEFDTLKDDEPKPPKDTSPVLTKEQKQKNIFKGIIDNVYNKYKTQLGGDIPKSKDRLYKFLLDLFKGYYDQYQISFTPPNTKFDSIYTEFDTYILSNLFLENKTRTTGQSLGINKEIMRQFIESNKDKDLMEGKSPNLKLVLLTYPKQILPETAGPTQTRKLTQATIDRLSTPTSRPGTASTRSGTAASRPATRGGSRRTSHRRTRRKTRRRHS